MMWLLLAVVAPPTPFPAPNVGEAPPTAIVRLFVMEKDGRSAGSGTLVAPNIILTCNHVVKDRSKEDIEVMFSNWDVVLGKVTEINTTYDLAIVELKEKRSEPCLKIVGCAIGDTVTINGYGYGPYVSRAGKYYARDKGDKWGVIEGAQARSGDSGGPVTKDGELVGVLWGASNNETWFATGQDILKAFPFLKPVSIIMKYEL